MACFAQSWHWLDPSRAVPELVRVLAPDGWWSGWWSHPRADGEAWFDAYQDALERTCPVYDRRQRDTDWSRAIVASGAFGGRASVSRRSWTRQLTLATWLMDETSKSYVAALSPEARDGLLARIETILAGRFPDRELRMPYETWLWTARRSAA